MRSEGRPWSRRSTTPAARPRSPPPTCSTERRDERWSRRRSPTLGGPIDLLVNNAGLLIAPSPTADVPAELIDGAFAISVRSAFLLTGLVAPAMAARRGGAIVRPRLDRRLQGIANSALCSAIKATIHSLTKSWAAEYGPSGVRVDAVARADADLESDRDGGELAPMIAAFPSRRRTRSTRSPTRSSSSPATARRTSRRDPPGRRRDSAV